MQGDISDPTFFRILLRWTDHMTFGWVTEAKKAQDGRKLKNGMRRSESSKQLYFWQIRGILPTRLIRIYILMDC